MYLPNWLKIFWWLALVSMLTFFLRERLPDLLAGNAAAADIVVFGIWMALLLVPLFSEVTLLGITLKNEIKELKDNIAAQISEVRSDVRNAVDVRATFSPTFNLPLPPPDAQLPAIEVRIREAIASALAEQGAATTKSTADIDVTDDVAYLFATRYNIESELRRLGSSPVGTAPPLIAMPMPLLLRSLVESGQLSSRLRDAIREVISICNPVVHGEPVSEAKIAFVRDVAPELVAALRSIK